ncbi:UBX domain-containing protein 11 [Gaertneriomyces sp. JEL0708]|nr:UBX domain-containing protein 11 [Gaertneriomyces sp. JEL0708]
MFPPIHSEAGRDTRPLRTSNPPSFRQDGASDRARDGSVWTNPVDLGRRSVSRTPTPPSPGPGSAGRNRLPSIPRTPSLTSMGPALASSKPNDSSLISSLTKRLTVAERSLQGLRSEIRARDTTIARLEDEMRLKEARIEELVKEAQAGGHVNGNDVQQRHRTSSAWEKRAKTLQAKVWEMERALEEMGMVWQDDTASDNLDSEDNDSRNGVEFLVPSLPPDEPRFPYDIVAFLSRVQELNVLAGEGTLNPSPSRSHNGNHYVLDASPGLEICLYRRGFAMGELYRPYDDPTANLFLRDIMDGYFPYELKHAFPEGVVLNVRHKPSEEPSSATLSEVPPPSQLHEDRGTLTKSKPKTQSPSSNHVSSKQRHGRNSNIRTLFSARSVDGASCVPPAKTSRAFLDKLPYATIRNGKIVPIREDIAKILKHGEITNVRTISIPRHPTHPDDSHAVELRIRTPDGTVIQAACWDTCSVQEVERGVAVLIGSGEVKLGIGTGIPSLQGKQATLRNLGIHGRVAMFWKAAKRGNPD